MPSIDGEATHPSVDIQQELRRRGWPREELARRMGGDTMLNLYALDSYLETGPTRPEMPLREDLARQLGYAFGTPAEIWLQRHAAWQSCETNERLNAIR